MNEFFNRVARRIDKLDAEGRRAQFRTLTDEIGFLESILGTMDEGVLVTDPDRALLYANGAAERLAGFTFTKVKGRPIERVLPDWDWDVLLAPPGGGADWSRRASCEIELAYPERRILEVSSSPSAKGCVAFLRDVTARRAQEAEGRESERVDAVRDLAAGVAHEIGNPLNAMSIHLQLLTRELRAEPDAARRERLLADVETVRGEVKRLDGIIRGFLSALRPAKLQLAPGSAADPLKDTLATLKPEFEKRRIRMLLDLPPALPAVALDRAQMEQVYFNLVKNALEAMPDGGELAIEIAADDRDVCVSFRDSGKGISDEALARLFEPYRTTKEKGSGLGLMVSRRIVRAHGGEIDVESKSGEGTRFIVRLPRLEKRVRRLT